eukprot:jgi/Ulvmu1/9271/UM050_0020.1
MIAIDAVFVDVGSLRMSLQTELCRKCWTHLSFNVHHHRLFVLVNILMCTYACRTSVIFSPLQAILYTSESMTLLCSRSTGQQDDRVGIWLAVAAHVIRDHVEMKSGGSLSMWTWHKVIMRLQQRLDSVHPVSFESALHLWMKQLELVVQI